MSHRNKDLNGFAGFKSLITNNPFPFGRGLSSRYTLNDACGIAFDDNIFNHDIETMSQLAFVARRSETRKGQLQGSVCPGWAIT